MNSQGPNATILPPSLENTWDEGRRLKTAIVHLKKKPATKNLRLKSGGTMRLGLTKPFRSECNSCNLAGLSWSCSAWHSGQAAQLILSCADRMPSATLVGASWLWYVFSYRWQKFYCICTGAPVPTTPRVHLRRNGSATPSDRRKLPFTQQILKGRRHQNQDCSGPAGNSVPSISHLGQSHAPPRSQEQLK